MTEDQQNMDLEIAKLKALNKINLEIWKRLSVPQKQRLFVPEQQKQLSYPPEKKQCAYPPQQPQPIPQQQREYPPQQQRTYPPQQQLSYPQEKPQLIPQQPQPIPQQPQPIPKQPQPIPQQPQPIPKQPQPIPQQPQPIPKQQPQLIPQQQPLYVPQQQKQLSYPPEKPKFRLSPRNRLSRVIFDGAKLKFEKNTIEIEVELMTDYFKDINIFNDILPTTEYFDLDPILTKYEMLNPRALKVMIKWKTALESIQVYLGKLEEQTLEKDEIYQLFGVTNAQVIYFDCEPGVSFAFNVDVDSQNAMKVLQSFRKFLIPTTTLHHGDSDNERSGSEGSGSEGDGDSE